MAIRWQIKFKSFLGTDYVLSIYDATYTGNAVTQLKGAANPFESNEDDDTDVYVPVRTQSGYVRFVAEDRDIVNQIIPTKITDRPVVLRTSAGAVCWVGFLSNEQYSQPWEPTPYVIEIPVVSTMLAMQGVEFTQSEGYSSLLSLLNTITSYLPIKIFYYSPVETPFYSVYVQNNAFREFLTIPERAERSTTNMYECLTLYNCVEHFCAYFGVSMREHNDEIYLFIHNTSYDFYEAVSSSGAASQQQLDAHTLESLEICGAENRQDYSPGFRRIVGTFETGKDKVETVFSIDSFLKNFSIEGNYPTQDPWNQLMNGNAEVLPYKNGVQQTAWMADYNYDYGGQIVRTLDTSDYYGASWAENFLVLSEKRNAGLPSRAMVFNIPRYIYLNSGEYNALNIDCKVDPYYDITQSGGFIKRLHMKVRVGNYWLRSTIPSGSTHTLYEWVTYETSCWLMIDNGQVSMKGAQYTVNWRVNAGLDRVNGFVIDMPGGLSAGYHNIYMELLCNAEDASDFGDYAAIAYRVSDLEVNILRSVNSLNEPTPDFNQNQVIRKVSWVYKDEYNVSSIITTKRGLQYGAGCAMDTDHAYVTTKYDEIGIIRRTDVVSEPRETLTVDVRRRSLPIDTITYNGDKYAILSQSVNWWDDINVIKIIKL